MPESADELLDQIARAHPANEAEVESKVLLPLYKLLEYTPEDRADRRAMEWISEHHIPLDYRLSSIVGKYADPDFVPMLLRRAGGRRLYYFRAAVATTVTRGSSAYVSDIVDRTSEKKVGDRLRVVRIVARYAGYPIGGQLICGILASERDVNVLTELLGVCAHRGIALSRQILVHATRVLEARGVLTGRLLKRVRNLSTMFSLLYERLDEVQEAFIGELQRLGRGEPTIPGA